MNRRALTLIELLVVVAILAILATILLPVMHDVGKPRVEVRTTETRPVVLVNGEPYVRTRSGELVRDR